MKTLNLVLAGTLLTSFALAEGREGHGGIGYVCRDKKGEIIKAELLDLWEPETLTFTRSEKPIIEQAQTAINKLSGEFNINSVTFNDLFLNDFVIDVKKMESIMIKSRRKFDPTQDYIPDYKPETGCDFEQIAKFTNITEKNDYALLINKEIYDHPSFSNTDRAALLVHEVIYKRFRELNNASDSRTTRSVVAALFSNETISKNTVSLLAEVFSEQIKGHKMPLSLPPSATCSQYNNTLYLFFIFAEFNNIKDNSMIKCSYQITDKITGAITHHQPIDMSGETKWDYISTEISIHDFPEIALIETTCTYKKYATDQANEYYYRNLINSDTWATLTCLSPDERKIFPPSVYPQTLKRLTRLSNKEGKKEGIIKAETIIKLK